MIFFIPINEIVTFNKTLENLSTPIVRLPYIDESSHENRVVVFQTCQKLEVHDEDNFVENKKGNII